MNREEQLKKINTTDHWDVVIIGGGATGLGAALDAACRGLKTLCIERHDFSKATSSRSTKLIHGGVRYLEQGNFGMVRDALHERAYFLKNTSNATRRLPFILPVYKWWQFVYYGAGLLLYDLLSGKYSIGKTRFLHRKATISRIPNINANGLKGGIRYYDGQFDDSEVCLALARTAISKGACVINYCEAVDFIKQDAKIVGVNVNDRLTNDAYEIKAKIFINATGVFADGLMKMDNPNHEALVKPSRGAHIVIDRKFYDSDTALLIPKTSDGRVLFALPWHDKVLIGTTDIEQEKPIDEPVPTTEEIGFILHNFNQYSAQTLTEKDVLACFAGLRPLVGKSRSSSTAQIQRDHSIFISDSGLVSISGGKWTTYRKMAEDVVNQAFQSGGIKIEASPTRQVPLLIESSVKRTGTAIRLHPEYPYTEEDVIYAAKHSMACTVEDVLTRRIRLLFLDARAAIQIAPKVADILCEKLGKDRAWREKQLRDFNALAKQYLP
jgi:glycerol-3-phosphate dehydrogenase